MGVLGLPDRVHACLFDLAGVLTMTATVHAAGWKEMFDNFLQQRSGDNFEPFDPIADYTTSSTVNRWPTGPGPSCNRGGSSCPMANRPTPRVL